MKNKTKAVWAAALVVGLAAGAISGASAAQMASAAPTEVQLPEGFLSANETLAVFNDIDSITDLTLPDGVSWPTIAPKELSDEDGAFEVGYIETTAHLYWLCAWENALVSAPAARGGEEASEELAGVQDFSETEWFADNFDDPTGAWTSEVLEPALAGDLTGVQEDLTACGYYDLNQ